MVAAGLGLPITPKPFSSLLRDLLMTGGAPLYLRAERQPVPRKATVAIEATPLRRTTRDASAAAGQGCGGAAKIAGRYVAPNRATARADLLAADMLADS